jgi:hypothetical protein
MRGYKCCQRKKMRVYFDIGLPIIQTVRYLFKFYCTLVFGVETVALCLHELGHFSKTI